MYKATNEVLTSENYPYGFKLKTTKTDWIEFKKGHGFRHMSQTINPKTNQPNKPKASTYYDVMVLYKDENQHVKSLTLNFYGDDGHNKDCTWMAENFNLFTPEQIEDIYGTVFTKLKASIISQVQYCGSNFEDLKPLFDAQVKKCVEGIKANGTINVFNDLSRDVEKIASFKVPDYNPFKVTQYSLVSKD